MELKTNEEILALSREGCNHNSIIQAQIAELMSEGYSPKREKEVELLERALSPAVKEINEGILSDIGLKFKDLPEERRRLLILV